jgi:hypothetical protein
MAQVTCTTTNYGGWPNCQLLTNGSIEVVATTDVGPRIIRCGFAGEPNVFFNPKSDLGTTGGDTWKPYGGHRLWHAPETKPRTYAPDNDPIQHHFDGGVLTLTQPVEASTGIQKEMVVRLHADNDVVEINHRLTNRNLWEIKTAAWCLSVMAGGGRAIFPHEPFIPFPDKLTPARPLVLWNYTNMADPRFTWGKRSIQLHQDANAPDCQKFGLMNTPGWGAYENNGVVFLKSIEYKPDAEYADYGCNWEVYTNKVMLEMETLSPLQPIAPGETLEHMERWTVARMRLSSSEVETLQQLEQLAKGLRSGS